MYIRFTLSPAKAATLKRLAREEYRSVTKQAEFMLARALKAAEAGEESEGQGAELDGEDGDVAAPFG